MSLNLDYYYGNEAEQYSFYRIPKILFTDSRFKSMSIESKVLYGLLLDRMALSVKNGWLDVEGRVFIIFTIADIMEMLGCAEQKANKLLKELDVSNGIGLIERKRRGLGKPNIIYVKNFADKSKAFHKSQIKNCENHKSEIVNTTNQDLRFSQTNNTEFNNTDLSDTNQSIHQKKKTGRHLCGSLIDKIDETDIINTYRKIVKENIDYDTLLFEKPYDKERLEGYVELIAEVCSSDRNNIRINQTDMPIEAVRERLLKLNIEHIRYVMNCMDNNTTLIGNIRAYTLSALYNAPVTISQYYASLVNHDMAECSGSG